MLGSCFLASSVNLFAPPLQITGFRFPADDNAQMHGWDGRLTAKVEGHSRPMYQMEILYGSLA